MEQTTVDEFVCMQYIKDSELTSEQLDSLINQLIDYKAQVDNEWHMRFMEDEETKEIAFNS